MRWILMVLLLAAPLNAGTTRSRSTEADPIDQFSASTSTLRNILAQPGGVGDRVISPGTITNGGRYRRPPSDRPNRIDPDTLSVSG